MSRDWFRLSRSQPAFVSRIFSSSPGRMFDLSKSKWTGRSAGFGSNSLGRAGGGGAGAAATTGGGAGAAGAGAAATGGGGAGAGAAAGGAGAGAGAAVTLMSGRLPQAPTKRSAIAGTSSAVERRADRITTSWPIGLGGKNLTTKGG